MSTRLHDLPDEDLGVALRGALDTIPPRVDVDSAITVGDRRRTTGRTAGALAAALAVAGIATGAAALLPGERTVAPAAGPSTTAAPALAGCTLDAATCDETILDSWVRENLAGGGVSIETDDWGVPAYADPESPGYNEDNPAQGEEGTQARLFRKEAKGNPRVNGEVGVAVSGAIDVEQFAELIRGEDWTEESTDREVTFTVEDEQVTARVMTSPHPVFHGEWWLVEASESHGAVIVTYGGSDPARLTGAEGEDGTGGWTDESVQELITRYLTEPPKGDGAG